jgi:predicted methyltransferase
MIKQYNQEGGTEDGDISEELSTKAAVSLSKTTLQGSVPKKSDIRDGQFYSLVCLEPGALTEAINGMKALGAAQRKALARRAAVAHEELKEAMESYDR